MNILHTLDNNKYKIITGLASIYGVSRFLDYLIIDEIVLKIISILEDKNAETMKKNNMNMYTINSELKSEIKQFITRVYKSKHINRHELRKTYLHMLYEIILRKGGRPQFDFDTDEIIKALASGNVLFEIIDKYRIQYSSV